MLKFESSSLSFLIALFYALITDVEGSVNVKDCLLYNMCSGQVLLFNAH